MKVEVIPTVLKTRPMKAKTNGLYNQLVICDEIKKSII